MVVVKRRTRSRVEQTLDSIGFSSPAQVPYGDGGSPRFLGGGNSSRWTPGRRFSFELNTSKQSYKWLIRFMCMVACVSMIGAYKASHAAKNIAANLEGQQIALKIQGDETFATLKDAREGLKAVRKYVDGLKRTQDALYHEIRMVNEMFEAESASDMPDSPMRGSSDELVQSWMQHRQDALTYKINNLKDFIQQESRQQVIEKYGSGPIRAKFTINFMKHDLERTFVIEMAPLTLMPHSVHMFLEMVRMGMWTNTVFWHHDDVEHIIAGALFNYRTGEPKFHHLKALGWEGLHFPEYSEEYPHDKYTIGFSGKGPNIYINLRDNQDVHGPGAQSHHDLPDEADPCFARIVEGVDVVDAMYRLSLQDEKKSKDFRETTWDQNELTRIVKVELV
ncbi:expressed unknown protein [Seminavis robusta]|uniref:PPIase cyclophilin-type domain-containing protein n=1 Tax=Seminavis robusta TaxID=568900 RepID=A0A9N8DYU0_9STRA|nr:expressed unknown protein [Seminavis robusta]|eukprot:Sro376_g129780.1 n/a (392) ;mRNA; r:47400-48715